MRIAINGRFSGTREPTGTQTMAYELYNAMVRQLSPQTTLVVFADSRFQSISEWKGKSEVEWVEIPFQDWSRTQAQLWEQFIFPIRARQLGCDVAHHPINTSPLWKNGIKTVVTLHDLNFLLHPEWFETSFRLFLLFCALPGIKRAEAVGIISEYVKKQALDHLGLKPERFKVIYNGVKTLGPTGAVPPATPAARYLLCVGSLQPHKNLIRLLEAFQILRSEGIIDELRIVGRPQSRFSSIPRLAQLLESPGICKLGYLSDTELFDAYAQAAVFCFPSLEEGFGLPILEAMIAGTLVVTSNCSCLPEVAGPAACLVDPYSVESIAQGLRECLRLGPEERNRKLEEGRSWAQRFTWKRAASQYLELYQKIGRGS